jgi:hypothetical protein
MMCAQCLERMCLTNYYVIREMHRQEVTTEIKLCSTICMAEWFE